MTDPIQGKSSARSARVPPLPIRTIDRLSAVLGMGAALGCSLLVLNIFLDVAGRALFSRPIPGTLEYTANWWMPMLALLAFAYTESRQEHIKVTVLLDVLPQRMRQIIEGVFSSIGAILLLAMAYYSWFEAMRSYGYQEVTPSSPPVAIWPFKFLAVLGMGMMALQLAATAYRYFVGMLPTTVEFASETDAI